MDKTALLKKIRALAEHGVGGEAENAEKLLARMMKKYGISEAELDEDASKDGYLIIWYKPRSDFDTAYRVPLHCYALDLHPRREVAL